MSASYNPIAVYIGGMIAMAIITVVAVFSGKLLASRISEKHI
jgi:putative Ca2+/H+ antiporter (TMEM165/GDT1 family)